MKPFKRCFTKIETFIRLNREPCFDNLLKVLNKEIPSRPTLFEFFLNDNLYLKLTGHVDYEMSDKLQYFKRTIDAFRIAGYDYVTIPGSDFHFVNELHTHEGGKSYSANEGSFIIDRESFEKYQWPDPDACDYSRLEELEKYIPQGMKIIVMDADGILEAVTKLVGFNNLCFMTVEDPELLKCIFDEVGSRMVRYHEICASFKSVGATIFGDDWAFNHQTMLSPEDLRKYVFPWHKKLVGKVHAAGRKAILHSCGNLTEVYDDIIYDMEYDAKHSFEDKILPVEAAYRRYGRRIAIIGGIDMDFIYRSTPEEVYNRSAALLEMTASSGGYALGSGNSIPAYVPQENYLAMIAAAVMN